MTLPDLARRLVDGPTFATLATVNPDGAPQSSVIWLKRDGDDLVFSTIKGRRKTLNMERRPAVSVLLYDPQDPYVYAELRGKVSMTETGGPELIDELSRKYDGKPWVEARADVTRLVCRVTVTKVVTR